MDLSLKRFAYTPTETQGLIYVAEEEFFTIERPWVRSPNPGGKPFESCIPDGEYDLHPFTRPNGDEVFALVNPHLGVFLNKGDRPTQTGRFLILIHSGNVVNHVVGCIAPGESRIIHDNQVFVTNSRVTVDRIMETLDFVEGHKLTISSSMGTQ